MKKHRYVGRQEELTSLLAELETGVSGLRVISVCGAQGMGKDAFYGELRRRLSVQGKPIYWFRPQQFYLNKDPLAYLRSLTQGLSTDYMCWQRSVDNFKKEISHAVLDSVNATSGLTHDAQASQWVQRVMDKLIKAAPTSKSGGRLYFVLDHYDLYDAAQKKWLALAIAQTLIEEAKGWDIRFLISSEKSVFSSGDMDAYWAFTGGRALEVALKPLSVKDVEALLVSMGLPAGQAEALHMKSKGVPVQLVEEIKHFSASQHQQIQQQVSQFFNGCSQEHKRWMHWAAHFNAFNEDTLGAFATPGKAFKAFEWLKTQEIFPFKKDRSMLHWDPFWQQAVLAWQKEHEPDAYDAQCKFAQARQGILSNMPQAQNLDALGRLSLLRVITEAKLKQLFPDEVESLVCFIKKNPDLFKSKKEGWVLTSEAREMGYLYRKTVPLKHEKKWLARIEKMEKSEAKALQQELEQVNSEMEKHQKNLDALEKKLEESPTRAVAPSVSLRNESRLPAKPKSWLRTGCYWGLGFLGIAIFYTGLLFNQSLPAMYAIAGLVMLAVALLRLKARTQRARMVVPGQGGGTRVQSVAHTPVGWDSGRVAAAKRTDWTRRHREIKATLRRLRDKQSDLLEAVELYKI